MSRRGWLLLATMGVVWGVPYLLIKVAVSDVTPPTVVFARTAVGAVLLLPFALRFGGLAALRGHWPAVLSFAVLEIVLPWILLSDAERRLSSSTTGLLVATVPIAAVVLGRFIDRQPVAALRWVGLGVALGGVVLLLGPGAAATDPWAVTQVLLAALGYATAPIIADRHLRDVPTIPLTTTCLALTALLYLPIALLTGRPHLPHLHAALALVALGAVCTALAFVLFFRLIAEVGAARSTLVAYLNPVVAVVLGAAVLHEPVTVAVVVATVLILAGSAAASRRGVVAPAAAATSGTAPVAPVEVEPALTAVEGSGPTARAEPCNAQP